MGSSDCSFLQDNTKQNQKNNFILMNPSILLIDEKIAKMKGKKYFMKNILSTYLESPWVQDRAFAATRKNQHGTFLPLLLLCLHCPG